MVVVFTLSNYYLDYCYKHQTTTSYLDKLARICSKYFVLILKERASFVSACGKARAYPFDNLKWVILSSSLG